jgi:hypothetical protein
MRAEVELTPAPRFTPSEIRRRSWGLPAVRVQRLDWFDWSVLALFFLLSLWVMGLDLHQEVANGRVWTGTDGLYIVDQMQYLGWIRSASHHFLSSNLYVLRHTPADYFMPAITISAGLTALGVAPWLTLLLWKPAAVAALFFAMRAFARRSLSGTWERRIAVFLGLFFCSGTIIYGSLGTLGDLFLPFLSWGYTFGLLAMAAMVFALIAYDRARGGTARRAPWAAAALGGLASLLHPWQGELIVVIVIGTELLAWRRDRRRPSLGLPVLALVGTGLPLLYYLILNRTDLSWQLARVASKHSFSLFTILLGILPLLAPALVAYRGWPRTYLGLMTRMWPVAALLIYLVSTSNFSATPLHAWGGITIPLAVLAVEGLGRLGYERLPARTAITAVAVAAATIPGAISQLHTAAQVVAPRVGNPSFIRSDEQKALDYLARDPVRGGVFTRFYLGDLVPADTGRRTFVGDCLWSEPNCGDRALFSQQVFRDSVPAATARRLVQRSGARFVLADCRVNAKLGAVLAPLTESVAHFGCAAVYTLKAEAPPRLPLAESSPHAALRPAGRQQRRVQHA